MNTWKGKVRVTSSHEGKGKTHPDIESRGGAVDLDRYKGLPGEIRKEEGQH